MAYRVINDGHPTLIQIMDETGTAAVSFAIKEKEVTPPGIDGGGENDTTTMHNTTWRTKQPKQLKTLTSSKVTAAYDPRVYVASLDLIQKNRLVVVIFPDLSQLKFWGWLDSVTPGANKEGSQPTLEVTFIPSNQDSDGNEVAPQYIPPETESTGGI